MTNVEPTAQVIDEMAATLRGTSARLQTIAAKMRDHQDLNYAADAAMLVRDIFANLRIDLLVTHPLREITRKELSITS